MSTGVRVVSHGLACPLGLTTDTAMAALHAGIRPLVESERILDGAGEPARGFMLGRLPEDAPRLARASTLARFALAEACAPLASERSGVVPCFLALPEPTDGPALDLGRVESALAEVVRGATGGLGLEVGPRRAFPRGRAGALLALRAASSALMRGEHAVALVGGVDSRVDGVTLQALADGDRLLGRRNRDGLLPGEGAAFVLLANPRAVGADRAVAHIPGCAVATEPNPRGDGGPCQALGLTSVFHELRSQHQGRTDVVVSAQTGEGEYEREFSYAYLRNASLMPEPLRTLVLGSRLGDAGAAAGAMALVVAIAGLRPAEALPWRGPRYGSALVHAESDGGAVGGCIVVR